MSTYVQSSIAGLDAFPEFIKYGNTAQLFKSLTQPQQTAEIAEMNPAYISVAWDEAAIMTRCALVHAIDTLQFFQVNVSDIPKDLLYNIVDHAEFLNAATILTDRWNGAESPLVRTLKCVFERTINACWIAAKTGLDPYIAVAIRDGLKIHPDSARVAARFGHIDCVRLAVIAGNSPDGLYLSAARGNSTNMINHLKTSSEYTIGDQNAVLAAALANMDDRMHMVDSVLDVVSFMPGECTVPNVAHFCIEHGTVEILRKAILCNVLLNNPMSMMAIARYAGPCMITEVVNLFTYEQCAVSDVCKNVAGICTPATFHAAVAQGYPLDDTDGIICAAIINGEGMFNVVLMYLPHAKNVLVRAAKSRNVYMLHAAIDMGHTIDSESAARIICSHAINSNRTMLIFVLRMSPFIRKHACLMIAVLGSEDTRTEYMCIAIACGCTVPVAAYVNSKTQKMARLLTQYIDLTDHDHFTAAVSAAYNNYPHQIVYMSSLTTSRDRQVCTAAVMGCNPIAFAFARKCNFDFDKEEMVELLDIMHKKQPDKYSIDTCRTFMHIIEQGPIVA
jgi:hypothetical protein